MIPWRSGLPLASDLMFAAAVAINIVGAVGDVARGAWASAGLHAALWCAIGALWVGLAYARQAFVAQGQYYRAQIALIEQITRGAVGPGDVSILMPGPGDNLKH